MTFSDLIQRLANGEPLSENDKMQLVLQAKRIEQIASLVNELVKPGTKLLTIDGLETNNAVISHAQITDATITTAVITDATITDATITDATITNATIQSATAGNGSVRLNTGGISILEAVGQAFLSFYNAAGDTELTNIKTASGSMNIQILQIGELLDILLKLTDSSTPSLSWQEDSAQTNRTLLDVATGVQGARLTVSGTTGAAVDFRTQGSSGGSTFMRLMETSTTPPTPAASDAFHVYIKGDKFIIQFNDAGTIRYKYLDLTGTGVTWVHTTTAP